MMYTGCLEYVKSKSQTKQGNQRWQIPRPATCQCLATFTPLKSKILIFFRDVISLLARVFILLIDTATQEVPMKNNNMSRTGLYDCHILFIFVDDIMSNINCGIGVLHVKRQILTYFL